MPLIRQTYKTEIRRISDQRFEEFEGFPASIQEAAARWGEALHRYVEEIVPFSESREVAKQAFISTFMQMSVVEMNGRIVLQRSFRAHANALALGMVGFTSIPPLAEINLEPVYLLGMAVTEEYEPIAELMSTIVDLWYRTGRAIPIGGTVAIPWS